MVNNLFDVYVFSSFFSSFFKDFLGIVSSLVGIFSFRFVTIIKFLLLFIFFVFLIATITLVERKVLALLQRRVGPNYVGYRGRLQFIADAVKLVAKQITTAPVVNRVLYLTLPPTVLVLSFLFWANLVWCPSLAICEIEYNLFFLCLLSGLFSILVVIIGFLSNNRYAMLSVARVILLSLNAEILFSFLIVSLSIISNSVSFVGVANFQDSFY
jgi:NADH-quinone oxidoreductase subunit H